MKKTICLILSILLLTSLFCGCSATKEATYEDAVKIILSDEGITYNDEEVTSENKNGIYIANDIVYYPEATDFTFGEGEESDKHSKEEADAHTVLHITKPGKYILSGKLSCAQVAVDLGEDAVDDPEAVVTLILDGADITCTVAPAVIFYNVYECSSSDTENASKDVDTTKAGANVIIKDGSINNITGSHVAKIYKSVELSEDGTQVIDSKKLHKYDAAFYSKMTMNIFGENENSGILNIISDNEGLDSELHLTINGGIINITSGNDGINTNEDYVSVTTINGGEVNITVTGSTGEGDGIDSNGWLVINGGKVNAYACSLSGDSGIDSDMGIYLNGGEVIATGNMLDRISGTDSTYAVFNFSSPQKAGNSYTLKNSSGKSVMEITPENDFSVLIISSDILKEGTYNLYMEDTLLSYSSTGSGGFGGRMPFGKRQEGEGLQMPEGMERPDFTDRPEREDGNKRPVLPDGTEIPDDMKLPGGTIPEGMMPEDGTFTPGRFGEGGFSGEQNKDFVINKGGNTFSGVSVYIQPESI